MDDLISRQALLAEYDRLHVGEPGMARKMIEDAPSVQPEPCGEMVSREVVVKFFDDWMSALDINCHHQSAADLRIIKGDIKNLPSAQPDQRWIPWDSGKFPEESGTYTVTAYDGATKRVTYAKYQKRLKRWELTEARAYWRVIAWQYLPEPYRGEQK